MTEIILKQTGSTDIVGFGGTSLVELFAVALLEARREALEKAAADCDKTAKAWQETDEGFAAVLKAQAQAIRQLEEKHGR